MLTGFGLKCKGIRGAEEATRAVDQSIDRFDIRLIPSAEGVDYLGLGKTLLGVPGIVGELDVFVRAAVLKVPMTGECKFGKKEFMPIMAWLKNCTS